VKLAATASLPASFSRLVIHHQSPAPASLNAPSSRAAPLSSQRSRSVAPQPRPVEPDATPPAVLRTATVNPGSAIGPATQQEATMTSETFRTTATGFAAFTVTSLLVLAAPVWRQAADPAPVVHQTVLGAPQGAVAAAAPGTIHG
jgi:hypothetical protein